MSNDSEFREHFIYLSDERRMQAYERALPLVIREGDRVLDLASGTSVLGLLALRLGASQVTSVDVGAIIEFARKVVRKNGLEDRVRLVRGHSTRVDLPREFDVVISDQVGCFGYDAGVIEAYADARERFLVEGGRLLPSHVHLHLAPMSSERLYRKVQFWETPVAGFDFSPGRDHAVNIRHVAELETTDWCGTTASLHSWDLATADTRPIRCSATMTIESDGPLHGLGGWAAARLAEGVTLTCDPRDETQIRRSNVFFPLERPVSVVAGDVVEAEFRIVPRQHLVAWNTVVRRGEEILHRGKQSTFQGDFLDPHEMKRHDPSWAPGLSRRGEALSAALVRLRDGASVGELREYLGEAYPDLARNDDELALLVDQVMANGTRP